jgi:hypothetical protein
LEEESVVNVKIYNLSVEVVAVEGMVGAPSYIADHYSEIFPNFPFHFPGDLPYTVLESLVATPMFET